MKPSHILIIIIITIQQVVRIDCNSAPSRTKQECIEKLLQDEKRVPDSAFSASSYFRSPGSHITDAKKPDFSPKAARESYDNENTASAWCPSSIINNEAEEYLEIDLGRLVVISLLLTKGRFDQGAGKEFSPFYIMKYRRVLSEEWRLYKLIDKQKGRTELLKGPTDPVWVAFEQLDPNIVARYVRIYPYSFTARRVCMQLQIFGCDFTNYLLEYRIPQGTVVSNPAKLPSMLPKIVKLYRDTGYDGHLDNGLLRGGLGRLTDSVVGADFRNESMNALLYVGWSRSRIGSSLKDSISMWFQFQNVRNFTSLKIHGYNISEARLPRRMEMKLSVNGQYYRDSDVINSSTWIAFDPILSSEQDSWVQFSLKRPPGQSPHSIGRTVQLTLYFESDWMLLSELSFESTEASAEILKHILNTSSSQTLITQYPQSPSPPSKPLLVLDPVHVLSILLCILTIIVLILIIIWIIFRRRKNKQRLLKQQYRVATSVGFIIPPHHDPHNLIHVPPTASCSSTSTTTTLLDCLLCTKLFSSQSRCTSRQPPYTSDDLAVNSQPPVIINPLVGMYSPNRLPNNGYYVPGTLKSVGSSPHHMPIQDQNHMSRPGGTGFSTKYPSQFILSTNPYIQYNSNQQTYPPYSDTSGCHYSSIQSATGSDNESIDNLASVSTHQAAHTDYIPTHIFTNPLSNDMSRVPEPDIVAMLPHNQADEPSSQQQHFYQPNVTGGTPQYQQTFLSGSNNINQSPAHLSLLKNQYT